MKAFSCAMPKHTARSSSCQWLNNERMWSLSTELSPPVKRRCRHILKLNKTRQTKVKLAKDD